LLANNQVEEEKSIAPEEKAKTYVKGILSDLLQNRIDLSQLVISKGLGKRLETDGKGTDKNTYKNKNA